MKNEPLGLFTQHHWTLRSRIGSSPKHWPMSFAGILLLCFTSQAAELVEAKVIVPPHISVRIITNSLPVQMLVIVPTNTLVQVIQTPVKKHGCDTPITYVTSGSITDEGGPHLMVAENKVFRRMAVEYLKPKSKR